MIDRPIVTTNTANCVYIEAVANRLHTMPDLITWDINFKLLAYDARAVITRPSRRQL